MSWFGNGKRKNGTSPLVVDAGGELGMKGRDMVVNPPANIALKRKEGRFQRIKLMITQLEVQPEPDEERLTFFRARARILDTEIKIAKGEY